MGIVWLIVLLPVWAAVVVVAVTFPLAAWVFPGGGARRQTESPLARGVGMLLTAFLEWAATVWVGYLVLLRPVRRGGPHRSLPPGRCPVALLPGFMENAVTLSLLERRLEARLGVPVRALTPPAYFGALENLAAGYRLQIEAWMAATGAKQVDLVGHSMGGILARYLTEIGGLAGKVRTVVTIAAPHQGSALSMLVPGKNLRQMRRGSAFLERLNAHAPPRGTRWVGLCSSHDNLVVPWNCALSPHGDNLVLHYRGHITLIYSSRVAELIAQRLQGGGAGGS